MRLFGVRVSRATAVRRLLAGVTAISMCSAAELPSAMTHRYAFNNIVDTTQGFLAFGPMPAVSNAGAVAFTAIGQSFLTGAVLKADHDTVTTIASSADGILGIIGSAVDVNDSGAVAFTATLAGQTNGNGIVATGKGAEIKILVNAIELGMVGRFLSLGGLNDSGTAVVLGSRLGFGSQMIVTSDGRRRETLIDTNTSVFAPLGNADINDSGNVVFRSFLPDGTEGLFVGVNGSTVIADTRDLRFSAFLEPVINDSGTVGSAAFLSGGGALVFTRRPGGELTPRNNPANPLLLSADNVCINNSGHIAFVGDLPDGKRAIYVETTGRSSLVAVIASGDLLFGSTVVELNMGTHSLNDRDQISFQYRLADGRSGIAVAYAVPGSH